MSRNVGIFAVARPDSGNKVTLDNAVLGKCGHIICAVALVPWSVHFSSCNLRILTQVSVLSPGHPSP